MNTVDYPCGICGKEVESEDKAIQCESDCMCWFHARCVSLTDSEYEQLSKLERMWECPACRNPEFPELNSRDAVDTFHFDFQQNQVVCWEEVLSEIAVDLPVWSLFCIH